MDDSVYRHLLSKIKKSGTLPHHNIPSHNLLSVENLLAVSKNLNDETPEQGTSFLASFPCYQRFPYSVYKNLPLFCGSGLTDNASQLVKKKLRWEKQLRNLTLNKVDEAVKQIKALKQNKVVKVSGNLRKYINHFRNDPEPRFSGNYNWLYTGGTLDYIEEYNGVLLVTADSFGKKPGFNTLKLNESSDEIQYKSSSSLKSFSPVLQICCKSNLENLFVCVRQKNHVNLFSIKGTDCLSQPVKVWRKKVLPPKLMISADIKNDCEEVILSDSNHDLHVFHIEQKTKIYGCAGRKIFPDLVRDPWSQVAFGDHGIYVSFRNCFVMLDPRDLCSGTTFHYSPTSAINNCEDICSFVKSSSDCNFLYLATTHSVLQLDLRNGETVQKWTHLMKKPPQFLMNTKDGERSELLLLQSQDVAEVSGIVNECKKDEDKVSFLSVSLPCLLRSVKESLAVARFHGVCLSPFIAERINFVVTGMQCLKDDSGDINVFTMNGAGDVFLSKMCKSRSSSSAEEKNCQETVKAMKIYESRLESFLAGEPVNSQLEMTDMSHVAQDLKESRSGSVKRKDLLEEAEIYWKYHEMYSPENLEFCRDLLAQKILRVWGYGAEESELSETAMSASEKVHEWMCKN